MSQSMSGPSVSAAIGETVLRFKEPGTRADTTFVAKGKKKAKVFGPATVVKPCLLGALALTAVQTAMHVFLKV